MTEPELCPETQPPVQLHELRSRVTEGDKFLTIHSAFGAILRFQRPTNYDIVHTGPIDTTLVHTMLQHLIQKTVRWGVTPSSLFGPR